MEMNAVIAVGLPVLGGVVWLIRLEGRVNSHEKSCEERQKRLDERHKNIEHHLASIDRKLDRLIGQ